MAISTAVTKKTSELTHESRRVSTLTPGSTNCLGVFASKKGQPKEEQLASPAPKEGNVSIEYGNLRERDPLNIKLLRPKATAMVKKRKSSPKKKPQLHEASLRPRKREERYYRCSKKKPLGQKGGLKTASQVQEDHKIERFSAKNWRSAKSVPSLRGVRFDRGGPLRSRGDRANLSISHGMTGGSGTGNRHRR